MNDSDTHISHVIHKEELASFDHDPKDVRYGHGEHCYRNCKPVEVLVFESLHYPDGSPITDPEDLGKIRARRLLEK